MQVGEELGAVTGWAVAALHLVTLLLHVALLALVGHLLVVAQPGWSEGPEDLLGHHAVDGALHPVVPDASHDGLGLGYVSGRLAAVAGNGVGAVVGQVHHDAEDDAEESADGLETDHPDEDVDFVGDAEDGEELGDGSNAEDAHIEVGAVLVGHLPVVGGEDVAVAVVGVGAPVAEVSHVHAREVGHGHEEEVNLGE